jgi:hypothetical protein
MNSTAAELRTQWAGPGDILSLLLLIGGDIVQTAIAQLTGHKLRVLGTKNHSLSIAPVAFSFGWVAFGFSTLLGVVGDMRLMPTADHESICVTSSNGFVRTTRSWVLGRLLRDHETRHEVDARPRDQGGRGESIRIDVFYLLPARGPSLDLVWWTGWLVILAQFGIAAVPWALYGDWGVMLVTFAGTFLAAITCAMPQWAAEKWAGGLLKREKVVCLTGGNGHLHVIVLIGATGAWDLESMCTGKAVAPRQETRWIALVLAVLWTFLIISVSGLKENTWFLIGIGGLGMLQNVFAAGTRRRPAASGFHLEPFERAPTIIGRSERFQDDEDAEVDFDEEGRQFADLAAWAPAKLAPTMETKEVPPGMPPWLTSMAKEDGVPDWLEPLRAEVSTSDSSQSKERDTKEPDSGGIIYAAGVHGALMELEKWVPTAGLAMVQIFFPAGLKYSDESVRDNVHKKFWRRAYYTSEVRARAEKKRRAMDGRARVVGGTGDLGEAERRIG